MRASLMVGVCVSSVIMGLKHQAVSARKWRIAIRRVESHFPSHLPPLLFLTDPKRTPDPVSVAAHLPAGSGVLYRHFGAEDRCEIAAQLAMLCRRKGLRVLIAADPQLAVDIGADGVHWPEALAHHAPKWRTRFALQTASAHSRSAISKAARMGVDAALVSTVFSSSSPSAGRPMGALSFAQQCRESALPLYALGGVKAGNAIRVASVGGLAAIEGLS